MNEVSDTKRLADATAALASTILEVINKKMQAQPPAPIQEQAAVQRVIEPIMTKEQLAKHFQVSARTMSNWLQHGYIPHYKIGRTVRIRLADVERHWNAHLLVGGRSELPRRLLKYRGTS